MEGALAKAASSAVHQVDAVSRHLLQAGGKRFRPACVALAARAVNEDADTDRVVAVATALELVHTATLVHDDVVDNTWVRRGTATANAVFGNGIAVLTGDFLLAQAVRILAEEGDSRLFRALAQVTIEMTEGEVLEMVWAGDPGLSLDSYYELIRKKTAAFISGCCRIGAIIAGASPVEEEALARYGMSLGLAFQLKDDLLDYAGDPAVTGKPIGTDLREGRATFPLLVGLRELRDGKRETVLEAFGNSSIQDHTLSVVVRTLHGVGAFAETDRAAHAVAREAVEALQDLRPSPYREALELLADYSVRRDR